MKPAPELVEIVTHARLALEAIKAPELSRALGLAPVRPEVKYGCLLRSLRSIEQAFAARLGGLVVSRSVYGRVTEALILVRMAAILDVTATEQIDRMWLENLRIRSQENLHLVHGMIGARKGSGDHVEDSEL